MGALAGQKRVIITQRMAKAAAEWLENYSAPEPSALGCPSSKKRREENARKLSRILTKAAARKRASKCFTITIERELIQMFVIAGTARFKQRLVAKAHKCFERAWISKPGRKRLDDKALFKRVGPHVALDERHRKRLKKRALWEKAFDQYSKDIFARGQTLLTTDLRLSDYLK